MREQKLHAGEQDVAQAVLGGGEFQDQKEQEQQAREGGEEVIEGQAAGLAEDLVFSAFMPGAFDQFEPGEAAEAPQVVHSD